MGKVAVTGDTVEWQTDLEWVRMLAMPLCPFVRFYIPQIEVQLFFLYLMIFTYGFVLMSV